MSQPASDSAPVWHALSVDAVMSHLHSPSQGLAEADVERRFARYGPNELQAAGRVSPWAILFQQFKNVLIMRRGAMFLSASIGFEIDMLSLWGDLSELRFEPVDLIAHRVRDLAAKLDQ